MFKQAIDFMQSAVSRFSKLILWGASLVLVVVVIIQISIAGAIVWLNNENGQMWLNTQLTKVVSETGYDISFERVSYSFPQGFYLDKMVVSDDGGRIASLNDVLISPHLFGLGLKNLEMAINVEQLVLYRLPESPKDAVEEDTNFALEPFSLPDIYFSRFSLEHLNIKRLRINESVFGMPLVFAPRLETTIELGNVIDLRLDLHTDKAGEPLPYWMPENIRFSGSFDHSTLDVVIDELEAGNKIFTAFMKGNANLGHGGIVNLRSDIIVNQLAQMTDGYKGRAVLQAAIGGTLHKPTFFGDGTLSIQSLDNNQFDDVHIIFEDHDLSTLGSGQLIISSAYQDKPVELTASIDIDTDNSVLLIKNIAGQAPSAKLTGNVSVNIDTFMAKGTLGLDVGDLSPYAALADIELAGAAHMNIALTDDEPLQSVTVSGVLQNLKYKYFTARKADFTTVFSDIQRQWPDHFSVTLSTFKPSDDIVVDTLDIKLAESSADTHTLNLEARGKAIQSFTLKGGAVFKGLKDAQFDAQKIDLRLNSKGSSLILSGSANHKVLDMRLQSKDFGLESLPVNLPDQLSILSVDAAANIMGTPASPVINARADFTPFTVIKDQKIKLSTQALYEEGFVNVTMTGSGKALQKLDGKAKLPLKLSFYPFVFTLPDNTPLEGQFDLASKAQVIAPVLLPAGHKLTGDINVRAGVSGTIESPDITGMMHILDGSYAFDAYGVALYNVQLDADLTRDQVLINKFSADDGGAGRVNGQGFYSLAASHKTDIALKIHDYTLFDSDDLKGTLSAALDLEGSNENYLLRGDVNLGKLDIIIPERFRSNIPTLNIIDEDNPRQGAGSLETIKLDVNIKADDRIFVHGWGLNAEFGGRLALSGTFDDPQFNGTLSAKRGRYEEFGRRFRLERANLRFQERIPPSPYLDILAVTDANDISARVNLTGTIKKPEIKLSSVPALPEDEVMSHILFGENISKITPFQAIKLKQSMDRLTGKGSGFDPLGKLRDVTGLDDINVQQNDSGDTSLGVGKYLSEDVYLELEKGAGEQSGTANIEVEITPNISAESKIGQNAQAGGGVYWSWDY